MTWLESLKIDDNGLISLHESIENLKSLKKLNLECNPLTSLPESIKNRKLLVDYHGTPLIRDEYETLMELENKVGKIPAISKIKWDSFGFIVNENQVVQIGLYNKRLTSLPESIGNLTSLTRLNLNKNQLSSLPDTIGNLKLLTSLSLGDNKLTSLPESVGNLKSLEKLYLRSNKLTSLPEKLKLWIEDLKRNGCMVWL